MMHQTAVTLNNQGVEKFANGDFRSALSSFSGSVKVLRQLLRDQENNKKEETDMILGQEEENDSILLGEYTQINLEVNLNESCTKNIVYANAILIPSNDNNSQVMSQPSVEQTHLSISVSIFNMALLYHVLANEGYEKCINKSLQLYGVLKKLLAAHPLNHRAALLIELAAMNNQAQLEFDIGQYTTLSHQSNMRRTANLFQQEETRETVRYGFVTQSTDLLLNIVLFVPASAAPAA